jgi:hypothetical protein
LRIEDAVKRRLPVVRQADLRRQLDELSPVFSRGRVLEAANGRSPVEGASDAAKHP